MVLTCNLVCPPNLEVDGQWPLGLVDSSPPNCAMFLNKNRPGASWSEVRRLKTKWTSCTAFSTSSTTATSGPRSTAPQLRSGAPKGEMVISPSSSFAVCKWGKIMINHAELVDIVSSYNNNVLHDNHDVETCRNHALAFLDTGRTS